MIKNSRKILGAAIGKLASVIGGIYLAPEDIKQLFVTDLFRIIGYLHRFIMTGCSGSNLFVGGIFNMAAGIPGHSLNNPFRVLKRRFHAPETATGKGSGFILC